MSGGMYLAAAGALVQQMRLDLLANNVANINTLGYKGDKAVFSVSQDTSAQEPASATDGVQPLSPYAPPFSSVIDFSQGALEKTGNPLDVAIGGSGFFCIQTPDGIQYTRQGNFTLNPEGVLVTPDGYPVLGQGGEITLDKGTVAIDEQGRVSLNGDDVDQLQITDFSNRDVLKKAGNGRFMVTDPAAAGQPATGISLHQGYLETSNVNPVRSMTEMIETARAFQAYQKVIQSEDDATAKSIEDVGKTV
jgi:flagellar basal-body rod protein FlgF